MHQNSVHVHWIYLISLEKVNAHLLTSKLNTANHALLLNLKLESEATEILDISLSCLYLPMHIIKRTRG